MIQLHTDPDKGVVSLLEKNGRQISCIYEVPSKTCDTEVMRFDTGIEGISGKVLNEGNFIVGYLDNGVFQGCKPSIN